MFEFCVYIGDSLIETYHELWERLDGAGDVLRKYLGDRLSSDFHGDFGRWKQAVRDVPTGLLPSVQAGAVAAVDGGSKQDREKIYAALQGLHPWRKGPWQFSDVVVDAEWRSDQKYDRLIAGLGAVVGNTVLDIGSGNGYYSERLVRDGADWALGVDPTLLFVMQHLAYRRAVDGSRVWVVPCNDEEIDLETMPQFDLVLSMGVLYHRRDASEHLARCWRRVRPGGRLVVETLVVDGVDDLTPASVPGGRYAKMRNVWLVPTLANAQRLFELTLVDAQIELVDKSVTTLDEQRATDWMRFESLADFLSPDGRQTCEGHPPPMRGMWIITKRI